MAPLSHKKDREISKSGFILKDQSVTLKFELSYNERTLAQLSSQQSLSTYFVFRELSDDCCMLSCASETIGMTVASGEEFHKQNL